MKELKKGLKENEDIIIVKNGFVTDSSFSNLIFFDGKEWYTPSTPLLKGTTRARLLNEKKITERVIKIEDIKNYKSISLINAFNEIGDILIDIENVTF